MLYALLKNPVALKVLVWSRGLLVTLQILTSSSFSLVEETHGSLGQCVSLSLIDVGSGFTGYVVFLFSSLRGWCTGPPPQKAPVSPSFTSVGVPALHVFRRYSRSLLHSMP